MSKARKFKRSAATSGPAGIPSVVQLPGGIRLTGVRVRAGDFFTNDAPRTFEILAPGTPPAADTWTLFADENAIRQPMPAAARASGAHGIVIANRMSDGAPYARSSLELAAARFRDACLAWAAAECDECDELPGGFQSCEAHRDLARATRDAHDQLCGSARNYNGRPAP